MRFATFRALDGLTRTGLAWSLEADTYVLDIGKLPAITERVSGQFDLLAIVETAHKTPDFLAAVEAACLALMASGSITSLMDQGYAFAGSDISFLPPILKPGKILAVGSNYKTHVKEGEGKAHLLPAARTEHHDNPVLFAKVSSSLVGHGAEISYPTYGTQLDYEAELCVVIGRVCKNVSVEEANDCIFGYSIGNDVSVRELQFSEMRRGSIMLGKNLDTCGPIGPWLVTKSEIPEPQALGIRTFVNGVIRQQDSTANMNFKIGELVSYCSHMTLHPGDIIFTGTPAGVAIFSADPERDLLKVGDEVAVEIDGLGRLVNVVGESCA